MADPAALPTLALVFTLGLRHGVDPDHVAIIDNLTFRSGRSWGAPWTGTFFAFGHSLSVASVAIAVAAYAGLFAWPAWMSGAVEWAVIALFLVIAAINAAALRRGGDYAPVGWRQKLVPQRLLTSSRPLAVIGAGALAGLMFDTATQAAAWGAAASASGGIADAVQIALAFACGMASVDTLDSQLVARLLRRAGDRSLANSYRRAVGWLIVGLSLGMAAYALAGKLAGAADMTPRLALIVGLTMALAVIVALVVGELPALRRRPRRNPLKVAATLR